MGMHTKHSKFGKFQITCQATCWESLQAFIDHMDVTLYKANVSIETNPSAAFHPDARSFGTYPASQVYTGPTSKHKYSFMAMPWLTATQYCNGNPENSRFKNTGAYHTKPFTDHMLSTMYKYLTMDPSKTMAKFKGQTFAPQDAEVQIDSYGGKINTKSVESTAVAQRSSIMKCQFQIYWNHSQDDDVNLWWISNFTQEMYQYCPESNWQPKFRKGDIQNENLITEYHGVPKTNEYQGTDGGYINYPDICLGTVQESFAPIYWPNYKTYARLQKAKKEWDPLNRFNFKQSISRADSGDALGPMLGPELFEKSTRKGP